MKWAGVLIFITLTPTWIHIEPPEAFILWNVGQGQWATKIQHHSCIHFDVGGEKKYYPFPVDRLCKQQKNLIHLSHLDQDHSLWLPKILSQWPSTCLTHPLEKPESSNKKIKTSPKIQKNRIKPCLQHQVEQFKTWQPSVEEVRGRRQPPLKINTNDLSRMGFIDQILIPGDATRRSERILVRQRPFDFSKIKILIAGHHGSRTSNGPEILSALSTLELVLISSRTKRYGHPHPEVLQRFDQIQVPFLKTEDWGHIAIEMPR